MLIEETAQRAYGGVSSCQAGVIQAASAYVDGLFHERENAIHPLHAYVAGLDASNWMLHFTLGFNDAGKD